METILRPPGNYEILLDDETTFHVVSHGNGLFDYYDNDDPRFQDQNSDYYTMMRNMNEYNDNDIVQILLNGRVVYGDILNTAANTIQRRYRARNFRQRARAGLVKNRALGQIRLAPYRQFNPNFPGGSDYHTLMEEMAAERFRFGKKRTNVLTSDIQFLKNL